LEVSIFSFKYAIINIVLGFIAGAFGSGYKSHNSNVIGHIIVIGAVIFTWYNFSFLWAIATFVELMIGAAIYGATASKQD